MTNDEIYKALKRIKSEWCVYQAMHTIAYPSSRQAFNVHIKRLIERKKVKKNGYMRYICVDTV